MALEPIARRDFLRRSAAGVGLAAGWPATESAASGTGGGTADYEGPNVVIVRFGGGVRRRETIDPQHSYAPYFLHELAPRGTLFTNMTISQLEGVETSHGQGTLYLLTGKYDRFKDVEGRFLGQRFESSVPTLFESLRKTYRVPPHQALIINGEDRTDEEFYNFSNHHLFGARYRSTTLSLYRFKTFLLRRQIEQGRLDEKELAAKRKELARLESVDYRLDDPDAQAPEISAFWEDWRRRFGDTGLVNARGDGLLTQLALDAIAKLRPRLMMINYNDPDYVHWGNASHYTRGISVIDQGLRQLVTAIEADDFYRENTVFVIVPDCGRDTNRALSVPFQHHFNTKSSHEIFALVFGPGIARRQVIDHEVDQTSVASTVAQVMKMPMPFAEGPALGEALA